MFRPLSKSSSKWLALALVLLLAATVSLACRRAGKQSGSAGQPNTSQTGDRQPGQNANPGNKTKPNETPAQVSASHRQLIERVRQSARQGKLYNCRFTAGKTAIDEVEKIWGKPDKVDYVAAAKGQYATYGGRGVVLGFNKGSQVFELRNTTPELRQLIRPEIEAVLGKPALNRNIDKQAMIGYQAGTDFKLEFVFSSENNSHLDHVNVLYPRGTVNQMADDPGREW